MSAINDSVLDAALNIVKNNTEKIYILSADPGTTWSNIGTYALGSKSTPSFTGPADRTGGGRDVTISAITDGSVSGTGTATHFALTDDSETSVLVSGPLSVSQAVTSGNTFTLTSFKVGIPDPA